MNLLADRIAELSYSSEQEMIENRSHLDASLTSRWCRAAPAVGMPQREPRRAAQSTEDRKSVV